MDNRDQDATDTVSEEFYDSPREIGNVKWFDPQKGYGFIRRENGSDVFVHFSHVDREPQRLYEHEQVEFTPIPGEKGPEARRVIVLTEAPGKP